MIAYIGNYVNFIGPYQIAQWLKHFGYSDQKVEVLGDYLSTTWLNNFTNWLYHYRARKVFIKLHPYDSWNMDETLAVSTLNSRVQVNLPIHYLEIFLQ